MDLGVVTMDGMPKVMLPREQDVELFRVLNSTLSELLGNRHFRWTSIRPDKNHILRPRIATAHTGPSVHLMMGDFKGGVFRGVDGVTRLDKPNQLLVFDPHKPHLSEHFSGTKFAITFYFDRGMKELSLSDRTRLRSLGFNLDAGVFETTPKHRPVFDPLTATPGTDRHLVPPDAKEGATESPDSMLS